MSMFSDEDNVIDIRDKRDPNSDIQDRLNFIEEPLPPDAKRCLHSKTIVNEYDRTLICRLCGATLDPFDYLLSIAKNETRLDWNLRTIRSEIRDHREGLEKLNREEQNTRGRIKNALFKLADVNQALLDAGEALIKVKGYHGLSR